MASLIPLAAGFVMKPDPEPSPTPEPCPQPDIIPNPLQGQTFEGVTLIESTHCPEDAVYFMKQYADLAISHPNVRNKLLGIQEAWERELFRDGTREMADQFGVIKGVKS
jgi:hypothetical protein